MPQNKLKQNVKELFDYFSAKEVNDELYDMLRFSTKIQLSDKKKDDFFLVTKKISEIISELERVYLSD